MSPPTLVNRELNRAFLARQLLLVKASKSSLDAIEYLVAMQAQAPYAPYVGLWARLRTFDPSELARAMIERDVVRVALMRSTIHLVSARECLALRSLTQAAVAVGPSHWAWRSVGNGSKNELLSEARRLLEEKPRTFADISRALERRWPDAAPNAIGILVRSLLPLVQIPPRGLWGNGGPAAHVPADIWLSGKAQREVTARSVVFRYLTSCGPASTKDIRNWSGVGALSKAMESMKDELRQFRDENGVVLYDVPDGLLPDPGTPTPIILLPEYDNALLTHLDRTRIIARKYREAVFNRGTVLVDGYVRGAWNVVGNGARRTLRVELFEAVSRKDRCAIEEKSEELREFLATHRPVGDVAIEG